MGKIGETLLKLKTRSGLSLDQIAKGAGYKGRSSIQKLFNDDYEAEALSAPIAARLERALVGKGKPQINRDEIWTLVGCAPSMATTAVQLPNEETFQILLAEVLEISADVHLPERTVRPTATTLALCLKLLEENPAIHANRDAIRAVVRAVEARPRDSRPEA